MKDLRRPAILFLLPMTLLANCAHLVQKREDYKVSSREPIVNGARLTAEMITTEGRANYSISAMVYFVAGETETGPYKCLLTAWGDRSSHKSMTVEKKDFRTASGQTASASRSKEIRFAAGSGGKGWQATYPVPGLLTLDFAKDGEVAIDARVAVRTKRRTIRRDIRLTLSSTRFQEVKFATVFDGFRKKQ